MNDPDGPDGEGEPDAVGRAEASRNPRFLVESLAHLLTTSRSVVLLTLLTGVIFPVVLAAGPAALPHPG